MASAAYNWSSRWLFSINKDIYFIPYFGAVSGVIGTTLSMLLRIKVSQKLTNPLLNNQLNKGEVILFFVMPVMIGGYGNWMIPLMIGAPDMKNV